MVSEVIQTSYDDLEVNQDSGVLKKMPRDQIGQLIDLLRQTTTLKVASDFLEKRKLHHTAGSWEIFENSRIRPALENGDLSLEDIFDFLRSSEEFGKQHVFLYESSKSHAKEQLEPQNIKARSESAGLKGVYEEAEVLDRPEDLTVADIRLDTNFQENNSCLVVKIIDSRARYELSVEDYSGDKVVKEWQRYLERSVNVVRVHSDGIMEIRVGPRASATDYEFYKDKILDIIEPIIDLDQFRELSLKNAKERLWHDREELTYRIRFSDHILYNPNGVNLKLATGSPKDNLIKDPGAKGSLQSFLDEGAEFDGSNIWFKQKENGLAQDVHVLLKGKMNEFAITAHISREDYEYVLGYIKELNKPISH